MVEPEACFVLNLLSSIGPVRAKRARSMDDTAVTPAGVR